MLIEPGQFITREWQCETYLVFVLETTLDYIKGLWSWIITALSRLAVKPF